MNVMQALPLAAVSFVMTIVAVFFILIATALVLAVLVQKGRGTGLGGAFGGLGAGGLFGTKTGDFLTWVTIGVTALFLLLTVVMDLYYKPVVSELPTGQPAPVTPSDSSAELPTVPQTDQPSRSLPPAKDATPAPTPTADSNSASSPGPQ